MQLYTGGRLVGAGSVGFWRLEYILTPGWMLAIVLCNIGAKQVGSLASGRQTAVPVGTQQRHFRGITS
eukprot:scaffold6405_cov148-Skeletonema_dohrnii-CCMP3373.AAC.2